MECVVHESLYKLLVESRGSAVPLSTWFDNHKPTLFPSGDGLITGDGHQLTGQQLSLVWR